MYLFRLEFFFLISINLVSEHPGNQNLGKVQMKGMWL